ncbi:MAG: PepSY-associated TM helix domain-containing protein, partial [Bacteroidota bacterium]
MNQNVDEHHASKRTYNSFFNTHTVSGIVISIGVFVIFLAGAFALFQNPINNWEVNLQEKEIAFADVDYDQVLEEVANKGYAMYGRTFSIQLQKNQGNNLVISANSPVNLLPADSLSQWSVADSLAYTEANKKIEYVIEPATYELRPLTELGNSQQRIGSLLTHLHYFRQIPVIGIYLSGVLSLILLFAIVSGVIIHWKKIVSNFFTFRLKSSIKNLWTDGHTALGILGLPYQFMYAVTGTLFGLTILAVPIGYLVFGDVSKATTILIPENKNYELHGRTDQIGLINTFVLQFLEDLPQREAIEQFQVLIKNYGDTNAHLTVSSTVNTTMNFAGRTSSTFRLQDGAIVDQRRLEENSFRNSSLNYFIGLHFGNFGGLFVRIVYFVMAVLTCFVIVSGVMIWLVSREKKTYA